MSKATPKSFEVTCPCCQARLTVDPEVRAVIAHAPPPKTGPAASLDQAMAGLRSAEVRREARFREAAEAEKSKNQVLARKFGSYAGRVVAAGATPELRENPMVRRAYLGQPE